MYRREEHSYSTGEKIVPESQGFTHISLNAKDGEVAVSAGIEVPRSVRRRGRYGTGAESATAQTGGNKLTNPRGMYKGGLSLVEGTKSYL